MQGTTRSKNDIISSFLSEYMIIVNALLLASFFTQQDIGHLSSMDDQWIIDFEVKRQ